MPNPDLLRTSVADLAADLRSGRTTATAVADAAIDRHDRLDGTLQASKAWDSERALREAALADSAFAAGYDLGPFQGLPVSVKDLYGVKGFPTFAGSPKRLPALCEAGGPVVAAVLSGRGVVTGKNKNLDN